MVSIGKQSGSSILTNNLSRGTWTKMNLTGEKSYRVQFCKWPKIWNGFEIDSNQIEKTESSWISVASNTSLSFFKMS